jgi:hypothetical protein
MSTKTRLLTDEKFDTIQGLIAEGKTTIEIAALFGVTPGTLKVYCSNRSISLRRGGRLQRRQPAAAQRRQPAVAEAAQIVSLRLEAKSRGMSDLDLVSQLIEIIVKDKLYDAVLGKLEVA